MKNLLKIILLMFVSAVMLSSCERVAPNYAGVLMENWGPPHDTGHRERW